MKAAKTFVLVLLLCAAAVAAASNPQATQSKGVARQSAAKATSQPAGATLATRSGSQGLEVDLVRAGVTGDIFTAELRYRNPTDKPVVLLIPIDEVSYIDDASSRRYSVVKDQAGVYMAAPLNPMKKTLLQTAVMPKKSETVWFKFPAPPAGSRTVSINIPQVGPFDGIQVQR